MTRYLLDTNIVLLGLAETESVPLRVRTQVDSGEVTLSVLSYWEVMLKSRKGKLNVGEPRVWWAEVLERFAATVLPLRPEHISATGELPFHHQDPFDRALIGQAIVEELTLVTLDTEITEYASARLRVLI